MFHFSKNFKIIFLLTFFLSSCFYYQIGASQDYTTIEAGVYSLKNQSAQLSLSYNLEEALGISAESTSWEIKHVTGMQYLIKNSTTGTYLYVDTESNINLGVFTKEGGNKRHRWRFQETDDGYFLLLNVKTGQALRYNKNEDLIETAKSADGSWAKWSLEKQDSIAYPSYEILFDDPEDQSFTNNDAEWIDTDSISGGALHLDGGSNSISFDVTTKSSDFSITLWMRYLSELSSRQQILEHDDFSLYVRKTGRLFFEFNDGSTQELSVKIDIGTWSHIALNSSTENYEIFINGELVGTFEKQGSTPSKEIHSFLIGANQQQDNFLHANIDEIRVFDFALSETDVRAVAPISDFSVVGYDSEQSFLSETDAIQLEFSKAVNLNTINSEVEVIHGLPDEALTIGGFYDTESIISGHWDAVDEDMKNFIFTPTEDFVTDSIVTIVIPKNFTDHSGNSKFITNQYLYFNVVSGINYSFEEYNDIPYKEVIQVDTNNQEHDHTLYLQITRPINTSTNTIFFWVHGGAWSGGTMSKSESGVTWSAQYLVEQLGITTVSIGYRTKGSNGNFSQALEDVNDAIDFIKENADDYNLSFDKIGLGGGSAGTPISSLISQQRSDVDFYVGINGLYDFEDNIGGEVYDFVEGPVARSRFGNSEVYQPHLPTKAANSAELQIQNNPPTILLHGSVDTTIVPEQSIDYAHKILSLGGDVELYVFDGAPHAFAGKGKQHWIPAFYLVKKFIENY